MFHKVHRVALPGSRANSQIGQLCKGCAAELINRFTACKHVTECNVVQLARTLRCYQLQCYIRFADQDGFLKCLPKNRSEDLLTCPGRLLKIGLLRNTRWTVVSVGDTNGPK